MFRKEDLNTTFPGREEETEKHAAKRRNRQRSKIGERKLPSEVVEKKCRFSEKYVANGVRQLKG